MKAGKVVKLNYPFLSSPLPFFSCLGLTELTAIRITVIIAIENSKVQLA